MGADSPENSAEAALLCARNIARLGYTDLPADAVDIARKTVINTLAVVIAASGTADQGRILERMVKEMGGTPESTILGFGGKVPAWNAGFLNGAMAHCLHYDDLHVNGGGHLGAAVVPAAIAMAEWQGASGKDLITAVALGTDLLCRLAMATSKTEAGWSPHPALGVFGAAAACGKILGLDEEKLASAIGIAFARVAGTLEMVYDEESSMRDICLSLPGEEGVRAALMAQRGITGTRNSFEGQYGLFNVYYRGAYDRSLLVGDPGKRFPATDVGFKPWPSVVFTHVYIDIVLQLTREHDIRPDQVEAINLSVGDFTRRSLCEPLEEKRKPHSTRNALFSLPFAVATAMARRKVVIGSFLPPNLNDPGVLDLAKRVSCKYDPEYDFSVRAGTQAGMVEISTRGGRKYSMRQDIAYGHPRKPMSWDDLVSKFKDCTAYSAHPLSVDNVEKASDMLVRLEEIDDVGQITRLLG